MASGRTHAKISLMASVVFGALAAAWTEDGNAGVCFAVGCLGGIILSPDLDQENKTISEAIVAKIPVLGWLFWVYFYPYALVFKHRSPLTHLPGLGTVIRLGYLFGPALWVIVTVYPSIPSKLTLPNGLDWFLVWVFIGLMASDGLHWIADGFPMRAIRIS